jgi:hypothetical protein
MMSQQLLCAPQPRSPPFISKPKELGGCIDGGHHSAAGPYSSGDNDDTNNKNIFKGVTLHLSARIIAWLPAPAEIE